MKKVLSAVLLVLFMFGCSNEAEYTDDILSLRNILNDGKSCQFTAAVSADYGESIYTFSAACTTDAKNNMKVTVIEPNSIAGVCGTISAESGALVFDDHVLAFEMIADGIITPISTPWLLMKALRGGYISSYSAESVRVDDTFRGCEFTAEVRFDEHGDPNEAEFIWNGKRIVSMTINDFEIL